MDQGDASKKKRRLIKKYQSPIRNKEVDSKINVRSSAELVRKYVSQSNKKLEAILKILPEIQEERRNKQSIEKCVADSTRSHQNQGNKNDKAEATISSKVSGTRAEPKSDAFVHQEQQNHQKLKKKSANPAMRIDEFLAQQGVLVEGEEQHVAQTLVEGDRSMPSAGGRVNDHMLEGDDYDDENAEHDIFDCDGDQVMGGANAEGIWICTSKKKMGRGKTTCKDIHARTWEERVEITFDNGQTVGPTGKKVNELTSFLGTLGRNPKFISLMYISWHAVPDEIKKRMWKYVKSKFIIPKEGKKWVMDGIRDAWKRYKTYIKKKHLTNLTTKKIC